MDSRSKVSENSKPGTVVSNQGKLRTSFSKITTPKPGFNTFGLQSSAQAGEANIIEHNSTKRVKASYYRKFTRQVMK